MSGRSITITAVAVLTLLGATAALSLERASESRQSSPQSPGKHSGLPESNTTSIVGFRVTQGVLHSVTALGEQRFYGPAMSGDEVLIAIYDWNLHGERPIVLVGMSDRGNLDGAAILFVMEGSRLRRIAPDVIQASLSDDARFLTYTTSAYVVIVADITGKRIGEFRGCVDSEWYGDQVILTHAVDGIGRDSSSDTELLLSSQDGSLVSVLVPSTFNAHHPSVSVDHAMIFISNKTGVSSFYRLDPKTRKVTQLTNVGQTSFGAGSVPVPARPGRWSPDGNRYAYDVRDGGASETWIVNVETEFAQSVARGKEPLWLDDSRILVLTEGARSEQRVVDLRR